MPISLRISQQMKQREASVIRTIFDEGTRLKQLHGNARVFDLSLGNPLAEPPPLLWDCLAEIATAKEGSLHRYMPNSGFPEARKKVAEEMAVETGLAFEFTDIVMTTGAAGAITIFLRALLDLGDEVVVIAPYFPEYAFYIAHQQGVMRIADSDDNMLPNLDSLTQAISSKTKAVIINSPNNPTGVVYPESTLRGIADVVQQAEHRHRSKIYIISDDAYRRIVYTNEKSASMYDLHPRTVGALSHSKDLGLAGERIGFLAHNPHDSARKDFLEAEQFAIRTLGFVNASGIGQRIAARLQSSTVNVDIYRRKRDLIYSVLCKIGYTCVEPQGAFYLFPKTPCTTECSCGPDCGFLKKLRERLVLVVPGYGFGCNGYFRISYSVEDSVLEGAIRVFADVMEAMR